MGVGLSTAWNAFRHEHGAPLIFEIKSLGFQKVELSFNLTPGMVEAIAGLSKTHEIEVASVHNFCPIPEGLKREEALPDYFSLASCDETQRHTAISYTKRSIDTAAALGATAVVLHSGRVEIPDRTAELIHLYDTQGKDAQGFLKLRDSIRQERKLHSGAFFEKALISLDELNRYAEKRDISLGIETRYYYREIPSFEELGIILEKFSHSRIYYWHDTGHAEIREQLGFNRHREYLEAYHSRLIGVHLHDTSGFRDHLAPLKGELDFNWMLPYINNDAVIKIIEAHHPATAQDLVDCKRALETMLQ